MPSTTLTGSDANSNTGNSSTERSVDDNRCVGYALREPLVMSAVGTRKTLASESAITHMSHIAICVRDMEASLRFYRELCGFEVVFAAVQPSDFTYEETMEGRPPIRHVVSLKIGGGQAPAFLTLTEYPGTDITGTPIKLDQVGITHVSFALAEAEPLDAFAERAVAMGFRPCGDQGRFRDPEGNIRMLFFYD